MRLLFLQMVVLGFVASCAEPQANYDKTAYRTTKSITYNGLTVDVVIDKPAFAELDALLVFHGTVQSDTSILSAANTTLDKFKGILNRKDMMIVSVAYPQEKVLFGDNIVLGEAALLWLKNAASQELGIKVNKVFLGGHSQGGYMVTRLNTKHKTNGVIANAPGPLNLVFRCELEEDGKILPSPVCDKLRGVYGTTSSNPTAYFERSMLNFTQGFTSDILFVQGLDDSPIQMATWPTFKQDVMNCNNCQSRKFLEIDGQEHGALFNSDTAKVEFNRFLDEH